MKEMAEEWSVLDGPISLKLPVRHFFEVFIHCSASGRPEHDDISVMEEWHLERGFYDVGYHSFIKANGVIQYGRDWEKIPAAQSGYNTGTLAICLHGLALSDFTSAQFDALTKWCSALDDAHSARYRNRDSMLVFRGHCEVSRKLCPVFDYKKVLGLDGGGRLTTPRNFSLGRQTLANSGDHEAVSSEPPLSLGSHGRHVAALQRGLNLFGSFLKVDGLFGRATEAAVKAYQAKREPGVHSDGVVTKEMLEVIAVGK